MGHAYNRLAAMAMAMIGAVAGSGGLPIEAEGSKGPPISVPWSKPAPRVRFRDTKPKPESRAAAKRRRKAAKAARRRNRR